MVIDGYSIGGYWCLLMVILLWILVFINGYFINGYWWIFCYSILSLLMIFVLVAIGEYFILDIGGY